MVRLWDYYWIIVMDEMINRWWISIHHCCIVDSYLMVSHKLFIAKPKNSRGLSIWISRESSLMEVCYYWRTIHRTILLMILILVVINLIIITVILQSFFWSISHSWGHRVFVKISKEPQGIRCFLYGRWNMLEPQDLRYPSKPLLWLRIPALCLDLSSNSTPPWTSRRVPCFWLPWT